MYAIRSYYERVAEPDNFADRIAAGKPPCPLENALIQANELKELETLGFALALPDYARIDFV